MAAYNVDIAIALKNSNKLIALRKELRGATKEITQFNKEAREQNKVLPVSINSFNKQLSRARKLLDRAAVGTSSFNRAAKALVNVEKEHNNQLTIKEKLLNKIRMEVNDPTFNLRQQRKQQIRENIRQNRALRFSNVNPSRPAVVGDFGQAGGRIGPAQALNNSQGGFLAFSKIANKLDGTNLKNLKQNTKTASILASQATAAQFRDIGFGIKGGQIGPAQAVSSQPNFFNRMGIGKNAQKGPFAMQGGATARLKGGIGSALIGGGFPALFGAGGLSSAFGAIAGGAGGALAPGGGFAASIFATAIAAQIEDAIAFRKEVKKLNAQMIAIGGSSEFSRKEIKQFGKELGITKEESIQALAAFSRFQDKEVKKMLGKTLGSPEQFDALAGITDSSSLINEVVKARDIIGQTKSDELLADLKLGKSLDVQLKLTKEIARVRREEFEKTTTKKLKIEEKNFKNLILEEGNLKRFLGQLDPESKLGKVLKDVDPKTEFFSQLQSQVGFGTLGRNLELFKKEFFDMLSGEEMAKFDEAAEKTAKLVEFGREYALQLQEFQEFRAPVDEIERLSRATRVVLDVSKELKTSFAESFKGIVKGTMTVTDAFRNMLNRIGDYFLDLAAQVMAAGIQKSFLGLFQNMFNVQMPSGMADGGPVRGGTPYIVGERGPELFTPGVSGNITPNESLGGSTNIVVNVDASGSSVEGNEQQGRELGQLISVAVQSEIIQQQRPGGLLA